MPSRQPVNRERIEFFLRRLGDSYRSPGRLYLVGGTTLVFEGLRQQTLDVDVVIEIAPENHTAFIQTLRQLKEELNLNIEEASPGDFIPLPSGYANRHEFIGRYGQIDAFHFDLYSLALSKTERGRRQDILDVLTLLRAGRLEWSKLTQYFAEILPQMGAHSLRQDPVEFEQNFRDLEQQWLSSPDASGETE